jgi:hypothetical protein
MSAMHLRSYDTEAEVSVRPRHDFFVELLIPVVYFPYNKPVLDTHRSEERHDLNRLKFRPLFPSYAVPRSAATHGNFNVTGYQCRQTLKPSLMFLFLVPQSRPLLNIFKFMLQLIFE